MNTTEIDNDYKLNNDEHMSHFHHDNLYVNDHDMLEEDLVDDSDQQIRRTNRWTTQRVMIMLIVTALLAGLLVFVGLPMLENALTPPSPSILPPPTRL